MVALLLLVLAVFLIFPLTTINSPPWLLALQTQVKYLSGFLAPYTIVALLGGIVGLAEITATFPTYPREALHTQWARILILVNAVAAIVAMIIAEITMPDTNVVLRVLGVGIGFQALIRTKFILAKQIGGEGNGSNEVSLNLGWLYDQFQNLCRTQIDLELMNKRRTAVTRLIEYHPTLGQLYDIAWYTIIARATLSPEEEKLKLGELEKLIDPKAPEHFAKTSIALMILENGGKAYVDLLLNQAMNVPMSTGTAVTFPDTLVKEMVDQFTAQELVALANEICNVPAVIDWVTNAAKPDPEASEAGQKAAIAHFLIKQVGLDKVQQAVRERP